MKKGNQDSSDNGKSLSEITSERILKHVVDKGYRAGDKLDNEKTLCEVLNVGRSTLREAVRMLASRNILSVRHGSGIYVSEKLGMVDDPFGFAFIEDKIKLVRDLIDFRRMIEPLIAMFAANNATVEQISELESIEDEIEDLIKENKSHTLMDAAFHTKVGEMSGNLVMPKIGPIINNAVELFINVTGSVLKDETISDHRAVIDAIKHRDPVRASDAMLLHIIHNRAVIEKLIAKEISQKNSEQA